MDKMYEYFYLAMLISASLLVLTTLVGGISKRYRKGWGYIRQGLIVITAVAMIGFVVTLI